MNCSYVYLITSSLFAADVIKVIISRASALDILKAHTDVYDVLEGHTGSETDDTDDEKQGEDKEEEARGEAYRGGSHQLSEMFQICDQLLIRDSNLLKKSLANLDADFIGFLDSANVLTLRNMVEKINDLTLLLTCTQNNDEPEIETCDLMVPQERVNAFDHQEIGAYESAASSESVFNPEQVTTTRAFELSRRASKFDPMPPPAHAQFMIFNKGYAYVTSVFMETFPEFIVRIHDKFPSLDLAEQMLWYQVDHLRDQNVTTDAMMTKIRSFFGCTPEYTVISPPAVATGPLCVASSVVQPPPSVEPAMVQPFHLLSKQHGKHQVASGSVRIRDMLADEPIPPVAPTITGTAPAFQIPDSPCGEAFMTGVNLWNSETRRDPVLGGPGAESVMIIKDFVGTMCHRARGHKVQSSKLFQAYKEFHKIKKPAEKPLAQAQFTILMKQISLFETHRYNNAIYWQDIMVTTKKQEVTC